MSCSFAAVAADPCAACAPSGPNGEMGCPRGCTIPGDLGITGVCSSPALSSSPAPPHLTSHVGWVRCGTESDVAMFHISLWSSVFLLLATCYGGCMLTYMDTGDDSIFNIDISDAVKKSN